MTRALWVLLVIGSLTVLAVQAVWAQSPAYTVTGAGTFTSPGSGPRFLGVDTMDNPDGGVLQMSGQVAATGLTFAFNVDVTCVKVVGTVAYLGGLVRHGTGSDGLDATNKVLKARLDDGSPDRARVSLAPQGTTIPADCFEGELTTSGPALGGGQIRISAVP